MQNRHKMQRKRKKAVEKVVPIRSTEDIKVWFYSIDWADWSRDWFTEVDATGEPLWKTIWEFVKAKSKTLPQRRFLGYYLGPNMYNDALDREYSWCGGPQDWMSRRDSGKWAAEQISQDSTNKIKIHTDAYEAVKSVGDEYILGSLARYSTVEQEIYNMFGHNIFIAGRPDQENFARAKAMIDILGRYFDLKDRMVASYARTKGVDLANPESVVNFIQIMAKDASKTNDANSPDKRLREAVYQLTEGMIEKSAKWDIPLPEDMKSRLITSQRSKAKTSKDVQ